MCVIVCVCVKSSAGFSGKVEKLGRVFGGPQASARQVNEHRLSTLLIDKWSLCAF